MKRSFKIVLALSLTLNIIFVGLQLFAYFQRKNERVVYYPSKTQKLVNTPIAKKKFLDSLYIQFPNLKTKKYLFFHFWSTHHYWSTKPLLIYDTLIMPLNSQVGYVLVNDEMETRSKKVLKTDSASTRNFLYAFNSEDFILAINQELNFKYSRFWYPKYPLGVIMRTDSNKIIFYDTLGIVGKSAPADSLRDKQSYKAIKKALNELE